MLHLLIQAVVVLAVLVGVVSGWEKGSNPEPSPKRRPRRGSGMSNFIAYEFGKHRGRKHVRPNNDRDLNDLGNMFQ